MITKHKEIWLHWRPNKSYYAIINKKEILEAPRSIGTSITAVNKMVANHTEQKEYMKDLLGLAPSSPEWDTQLKNYWHSFSGVVPEQGRKLDAGFYYDIDNPAKAAYIKSINAIVVTKSKLIKDEDLAEYIDTKISTALEGFRKSMAEAEKLTNDKDKAHHQNEAYKIKYIAIIQAEQERYKVGTPVTPLDYMTYRFCLHLGTVANEFSLVDKSPNIKLYLHSKEEEDKFKKLKLKREANRMEAFLKVIKDPKLVTSILYAMGKNEVVGGAPTDEHLEIEKLSRNSTQEFINMVHNKHLPDIAKIEKLVAFGILRRLDGSSIIVDAGDSANVIGNNIAEAITYLNNEKFKSEVKEFNTRLNSLPK